MSESTLKTISATEARNKWFEILNQVYFTGEPVVVIKNKIPLVKLSPVSPPTARADVQEVIDRTFGMLKHTKPADWPKASLAADKKRQKYLESLWKK